MITYYKVQLDEERKGIAGTQVGVEFFKNSLRNTAFFIIITTWYHINLRDRTMVHVNSSINNWSNKQYSKGRNIVIRNTF
jgi:hypothetical protein